MARGRKPHPDNYGLDFTSAYRERYALLMNAVETVGLPKRKPLARLVFKKQEENSGAPLEWSNADYGEEFGVSESTARRWLSELSSIGLLEIETRPAVRGGCRTNLVSINWMNVKFFATTRPKTGNLDKLDRPSILAGRPSKLTPRPSILEGPIKEYPYRDPLSNPSTTSSINPERAPQARAEASRPPAGAPAWGEVEDEILLLGVKAAAAACGEARRRGATPELVRAIAAHWRTHREGWEYPEQELYYRLLRAAPHVPADSGWPKFTVAYQRRIDHAKSLARTAGEIERNRAEAAAAKAASKAEGPFDMAAACEAAGDHAMAAAIRRGRAEREAALHPIPAEPAETFHALDGTRFVDGVKINQPSNEE